MAQLTNFLALFCVLQTLIRFNSLSTHSLIQCRLLFLRERLMVPFTIHDSHLIPLGAPILPSPSCLSMSEVFYAFLFLPNLIFPLSHGSTANTSSTSLQLLFIAATDATVAVILLKRNLPASFLPLSLLIFHFIHLLFVGLVVQCPHF